MVPSDLRELIGRSIEMVDEIDRLREAMRDVEKERDAAASLRPLWMDESVTTQVIAVALTQLWEKLGATTQTEACGNLDKILARAALSDEG